jgi:hypothetical protein
MLSFSAGIHVIVWEECYWRWRYLNESINDIGSENNALLDGADRPSHSLTQQARSLSFFFILQGIHVQELQDARFQWQNLTLFLAALGGSCISATSDLTAVANVVAHKFLPDRIRVIENPLPLIEDFISTLMTLLVTGDTQTRDIVREALGSELSPRLYGKLIKNLES